MEVKVLGLKINLLNAAIFLVLGFLISTLTVCSCSKVNSVKEAMNVIKGETKEEPKNLDESMLDEMPHASMHGSDMDEKEM
mgnify:CR=1 FL=1|tara:strand:+ start:698 stop:940 length:243 start_codon:yes stop_codon:yes gene_type:complete